MNKRKWVAVCEMKEFLRLIEFYFFVISNVLLIFGNDMTIISPIFGDGIFSALQAFLVALLCLDGNS